MLFKAEIVAPVNAPADIALGRPTHAEPVRLAVYPGLVTRVWVGFPPGCFGLAHLQVWHWGWPVWPWSPDESFHWDGYIFTFDDRYPLTSEPYEFVLRAWSFDDTFEHRLTFMCLIEPSPPMREVSALEMVLLNRRLMYEHMKMPRE